MDVKENFMKWDNPGRALITGASSGIGAEFTRQLAEQGFDLILVARRIDRLETLSQNLSKNYHIKAEILIADLSKPEEIKKVTAKILDTDDLDILINNAGFGIKTPFLEREYKQNADMINVHYTSPVMFCHAAIQGMKKRNRGVIINNASLKAITRTSVMYSSTKAALTIFSEALKSEVRRTGINIQALCPGFTYSEFHDTDSMSGFSREFYSKMPRMSAEEVVTLSLNAVKNRDVLFIPGEENRVLAKGVRKTTLKKYINCKKF